MQTTPLHLSLLLIKVKVIIDKLNSTNYFILSGGFMFSLSLLFRNSLLTISLLILSTVQVYSQDSTYLDKLNGKFALQFQITSNFTLSHFQGTTFSGKYHFDNRSAIRVGVSTQINNSEDDITASELDSFYVHPSYSNSYDYQTYSVNLQYLNYLTEIGRAHV